MFGYWYDYAKAKYGNKRKLCYIETESFIAYVKSEGVYADLAGDEDKI